MDGQLIGTILDLGTSAVLIVILTRVWDELKISNQFIREMLLNEQRAEAERENIKRDLEEVKSHARPKTQSRKPV